MSLFHTGCGGDCNLDTHTHTHTKQLVRHQLEKFQKSQGIPVTGTVTEETLQALDLQQVGSGSFSLLYRHHGILCMRI